MRFWDSSAIVPLCLHQPLSKRARAVWDRHGMVVWWGTVVECSSAIARVHREGILNDDQEMEARALLNALRRSWYEIQPRDAVRRQALRLLRVHHLRAADALQLAAAIEWAGMPAEGELVTFDNRLATAANREGFVPVT